MWQVGQGPYHKMSVSDLLTLRSTGTKTGGRKDPWNHELVCVHKKAFDVLAFLRATPVIARILEGNRVEFL
jgi:hypothetical protein